MILILFLTSNKVHFVNVIAEIDSDKATLEIRAEESGIIIIKAKKGDILKVGEIFCLIDTSFKTEPSAKNNDYQSPSAKKILSQYKIDNKIPKKKHYAIKAIPSMGTKSLINSSFNVKRLSKLRRKLSERLVSVKNETAMLNTFNEVDMSNIFKKKYIYKDVFKEKHGVNLGFMPFFVKSCIKALKEYPNINSMIDRENQINFNYYDVSIAVSGPKGLMVPVIRNADTLSFRGKELNKNIIILTATSGDTGAAVANAFNKIDGVKVVILHPSSKISILQEKQITTLGNNILALEIKGDFDDCQMLVKKAFSDDQIRENLFITSANSINIARLLSQIFYYFMCYKLLLPIHSNDKLIISIPSGNFGNICAGLIAFQMGLPVKQFIAATNINDTITRLLRTGIYNSYPTQETISNAMDISDPSNFSRIMYMFKNVNNLKKLVSAYSFSDKETFEIIKSIWENYKYIMDPHGAIGYLGLKQFIKKNNTKNIFLSTAAPVKFLDKITKVIDKKIPLENKVIKLLKKEKKSIQLTNKYDTFKKWLLNL